MSARTGEKLGKLAKVYDGEIVPAYAARFGALLMRHVPPRAHARVVEVGCATGHVTRELATRLGGGSHVTALDAGEAFVNEAPDLIGILTLSAVKAASATASVTVPR